MSVVEALAEVLRVHTLVPTLVDAWDNPVEEACDCGWLGVSGSVANEHVSAALVAAIRSMPAEQVAELIDGTTQRIGRDEDSLHRYRVCGDWSDWR